MHGKNLSGFTCMPCKFVAKAIDQLKATEKFFYYLFHVTIQRFLATVQNRLGLAQRQSVELLVVWQGVRCPLLLTLRKCM